MFNSRAGLNRSALVLGTLAGSAWLSPALACPPGEAPSEGQSKGRIELDGGELDLSGLQALHVDGQSLSAKVRPVIARVLANHAGLTALGGLARGQAEGGKMVIVNSDDGKSVVVEMKDGKVTSATLNGKNVASDHIKLDGGEIVITDDDGKEAARVKNPGKSDRVVVRRAGGAGGAQAFTLGKGGSFNFPGTAQMGDEPAEPPKVMLGVTLDSISGPLAEHFDIAEGDATTILSVADDLPGGKAGLKKYDIVIAIDGKTPCPLTTFQKEMRAKAPGDNVTLTVISKGVKKDVVVKLEKYDVDKLHSSLKMEMDPGAAAWGAADKDLKKLQNDQEIGKLLNDNKLVLQPGGERQKELEQRLAKLSERLERLDEQMEKMADLIKKSLHDREERK